MKQRDPWIGIGLVSLGVIFLLGPAINLASFGWPFFVIVPGAVLLFLALSTGVSNGALAVPGAIVTAIGLILLVFSLNGHWQGWAYAWTLIVAASGLGTYLQGSVTDDPRLRSNGTRTALYGLVGFVALGLFFELLVFGGRSSFIRWVLPIGLIVAGVVVLYLNSRGRRGAAGVPVSAAPTPPVRGSAAAPTPPAAGSAPPPPLPPRDDDRREHG